ncbi:MAG: LacI family DNA-binding transcriptional regulator [Ignavibacteriae bacterium]|nr:LacI family DNA-binding transcriptional regulator [Ignavibacteriota bacterium]MCB9208942.1 LacI family DNA-binding transcriptional regulator [Ignavibacteriales bacterium]MCB9218137.1 LacI family DNA-binding transcriptional regulator [Ignavibacteriales bacterium]MCB9260526.1 LacI family DNA-binding transcriptional regulator [Ignavibacteriales bacterium]
MNVKQSDIAAKLGISRVTVTKALQDSPDISTEMKVKVKQIAEEMDYIPNLTARHLTAKKTRTLGVILPDITNMYFSSIVRGMMEVAERESYHIILTVSREEKTKESENIFKLLSMNVDGLLVCQTLDTVEAEIFEKVKKRKKPLVFFGRPVGFSGYDSIGFDDFLAAEKLTEYLISKGKTKIAHISGDIKSDGGYRLDGFLSAMKKNKLEVNEDWIIKGKFFPEYGYEGFNKIFNAGTLPEVIFCGNGMIAQGVYDAIREKELKIPEDISVVAVDHKKFAEMLYPKLTYIDYPTRTLGCEAMKLIIQKIESKNKKNKIENIILDTFLIENDSLA